MSKVNHRQAAANLNFNASEDRAPRREVNEFRRQKAVPKRAKVVAYVFDQSKQSAPNVGDTVAIRHRTQVEANGRIHLVRDGIEQRTVAKVYFTEPEGYSIQDNTGEQWLVRPSAVGGSKWETFKPGEGRKEVV